MLKKQILEYSYKQGLSHIPSALSMCTYVECIFRGRYVTPEDAIIIGKPFGAQMYYLLWKDLGYLDNIEQLSMGVKSEEIPFVDYSEETMGNALGVAAGIGLSSDRNIWVNISDATLQMGNTLEAIQFIGHNQIPMLVTVDFNETQVTGYTGDIIPVLPIYEMARGYGWDVDIVIGNSDMHVDAALTLTNPKKPTIIFMRTVKGSGVPEMEADPFGWHYRKIESEEQLQSMVQGL